MADLNAELDRLIAEQNKTSDPVRKQEYDYEIENCLAEMGCN